MTAFERWLIADGLLAAATAAWYVWNQWWNHEAPAIGKYRLPGFTPLALSTIGLATIGGVLLYVYGLKRLPLTSWGYGGIVTASAVMVFTAALLRTHLRRGVLEQPVPA